MKMLPWRAESAEASRPPSSFSAIVRHLSIEQRRRELERAWVETLNKLPPFETPPPESRPSLLQSLIVVDQILGALPPRVRDVFLWAQFEGSSTSQIALRLGLPSWLVENELATGLRHCYALRSDRSSVALPLSFEEAAPAQITDAAIRWMVKLHFESPSAAIQQTFADWIRVDTRHAAVWKRLQWLQEGLEDVPPLLAFETLQAVARLRRKLPVKCCASFRLWSFATLTLGCQLVGEGACACMRYWTKLPLELG